MMKVLLVPYLAKTNIKVESSLVLEMQQKENRPEVIYINKNVLDFRNIHIIFS